MRTKPKSDPLVTSISEGISKLDEFWKGTVQFPTGFVTLDNNIKLRPGLLGVLCGMPKFGKTTFSLQIAHALCAQGVGVLYLDYENSLPRIVLRLLAQLGPLNYESLLFNIYKEEERKEDPVYLRAVERLQVECATLYVARPSGLVTIRDGYRVIDGERVQEYLEAFESKAGTRHHALFIDSLNKLEAIHPDNQGLSLTHWIGYLEKLRDERKYLIWAISQISRSSYSAKHPDISSIAHTSAIDYALDFALQLHDSRKGANFVSVWALANRDNGSVFGHLCDLEHLGGDDGGRFEEDADF